MVTSTMDLLRVKCPHCGEQGGEVFIGKEGTGRP